MRPILTALAAALLLAVAPGAASACSCAPPDLERDLRVAEAAVVGEVERVDADSGSGSFGRRRFHVRIERATQGDDLAAGGIVEIVTGQGDGDCGIAAAEGDRVALIIYEADGDWNGSMCRSYDPDELERALPDVSDPASPTERAGGFAVLRDRLAAWASRCTALLDERATTVS